MAEEINRRIIDHCAQTLFAPTKACKENLTAESVIGDRFQAGDTTFDVFLSFKGKADKSDIIKKIDLVDHEYAVLTTHRAENVDDPIKLEKKRFFKQYKQAK